MTAGPKKQKEGDRSRWPDVEEADDNKMSKKKNSRGWSFEDGGSDLRLTQGLIVEGNGFRNLGGYEGMGFQGDGVEIETIRYEILP